MLGELNRGRAKMYKGALASPGCGAKGKLAAIPLNRVLLQRATAPCSSAPRRGTQRLHGLQRRT